MTARIPSLLRAAVSVSILIFILARVSFEDLAARFSGAAPAPLAAALLIVLLGYTLMALRWRLLAVWLGLAVPAALAVRAVFQGLLGGQLLPSTLGADLVRGWLLARHTGSVRRAATSIVADRLVGLFGACLLLAAAHWSLGRMPAPFAGFLVPAALFASGAVLLAFVLALGRIDGVRVRAAPIFAAIVAALAIHALSVATAAVTALAYGVDASLATWVSIIPVALIACAVPVSINGWGVREAVIVALAAGQGIPEADALAVSLTLGVLNLAACLPGAYFLWSAPR